MAETPMEWSSGAGHRGEPGGGVGGLEKCRVLKLMRVLLFRLKRDREEDEEEEGIEQHLKKKYKELPVVRSLFDRIRRVNDVAGEGQFENKKGRMAMEVLLFRMKRRRGTETEEEYCGENPTKILRETGNFKRPLKSAAMEREEVPRKRMKMAMTPTEFWSQSFSIQGMLQARPGLGEVCIVDGWAVQCERRHSLKLEFGLPAITWPATASAKPPPAGLPSPRETPTICRNPNRNAGAPMGHTAESHRSSLSRYNSTASRGHKDVWRAPRGGPKDRGQPPRNRKPIIHDRPGRPRPGGSGSGTGPIQLFTQHFKRNSPTGGNYRGGFRGRGRGGRRGQGNWRGARSSAQNSRLDQTATNVTARDPIASKIKELCQSAVAAWWKKQEEGKNTVKEDN